MEKKVLTLCLIHIEGNVLLGFKKINFGAGLYNLFGGKVEPGETVEFAAVREVEEEAGVHPVFVEKRGTLVFHNAAEEFVREVHVFSCSAFEGVPRECEEMKPEWFTVDEIPYGKMFAADRVWLPIALTGVHFFGEFFYDKDFNLVDHEVKTGVMA